MPVPADIFCMNAEGRLSDVGTFHQLASYWTIGRRPEQSDPCKLDYYGMGALMRTANLLFDSLTESEIKLWAGRAKQLTLPLRQAFLHVNLSRGALRLPLIRTPNP